MALKSCKECGHQISKSATACPNCGYKLKRTSSFTWLVLIFIALPILITIFRHSGDTTPPPSPEQVAEQKMNAAQQGQARAGAGMLKNSMRNPTSFQLAKVVAMKSGAMCYEYRAQNGFGGTNVSHAVFTGDGKKLKTEESKGFASLWNKACVGHGKDITFAINGTF